jgi:exopolysaccharide production protein ExoY
MDQVLNRSMSSQSLDNLDKVGAARELAVELPIWKRALDLGVILLFSPVLVLVGGGIALLIKLGSPGPVLFRQLRVGFKGKEFICYKFRSMKVDAETDSHRGHTAHLMKSETPMTKLDAVKDPRIIPLGSLLRCTGLDELPQLINVLRGEMSLVGPRPCIPYEYESYEGWQRRRFDAVPGLTGLWQVSGKNRTTFSQMIHLDIQYAEQANLGLDLKIIFKTVPALIIQCYDAWSARSQRQAAKSKLATGSVVKNVRLIKL